MTKKGDGLVKRKKVMCVFYNKEVDDFKIYNKFMDILDENKKILKPLYYENNEGKVMMVFLKKKLNKFKDIIYDIKLSKLLNDVINGKHHYCSKCGCGYMTYYPYTYRNNCGCTGRSYECEACQMYSDVAVRKIRDSGRKRGTKKTLLKVLNGKFFKDSDSELYEEYTYEDELPF